MNIHKFLSISLIIILFIGTLLFFSQKNFSIIPQPTTKAQSSYPQCQQGRITSPCQCGSQIYNAGFCCYHPNANSGIWFDPSYEDIFSDGCPTGNFYFVDQNNPNASDSNPGTESQPWEHAWFGAEQLYPGDVLIIKEGWYYNPNVNDVYDCGIKPARSGTPEAPITIKAYPGHTVYLSGGPSPDTNPNDFINIAIGTTDDVHCGQGGGYDYIIIDGFKIYGMAALVGTSGSVLKNCEIWGGGSGPHQFGSCIRLEWSYDCKIVNNIIHDNVRITTENPGNCPLIMEYDSWNCVIENNEFFNPVGLGIALKDNPNNITIRYNLFYNCPDAGIAIGFQDGGGGVYVYQNVFRNSKKGLRINENVNGVYIYNNVFYDNEWHIAYGYGNVTDINIYNNIFSLGDHFYQWVPESFLDDIAELDYNCFNGSGNWIIRHNTVVASTLSEWKDWCDNRGYNFDTHSIADDPLFVNPEAGNFHLRENSPCRNGKDGVNMGAYITGDETIGLIDLSQYIVEESQPLTCTSQNGVCCNENQICQNGTFISSSDCGNLCCTGECVSPSILGDLNQDNKVNSQDFQILIQKFKETQNIETEDLNSDGIVDVKDIGILMHYWTN